MARSVLEMGGSANLLDVLSQGPVRGLRNWPAAMPYVHAGTVEARPVPCTGTDLGEERYYIYAITDKGRRKRVGFWGRFA